MFRTNKKLRFGAGVIVALKSMLVNTAIDYSANIMWKYALFPIPLALVRESEI